MNYLILHQISYMNIIFYKIFFINIVFNDLIYFFYIIYIFKTKKDILLTIFKKICMYLIKI